MDSIAAESLDLAFEQVEIAQGSELAGHKLKFTTIRSELDIVIIAIRRLAGEMMFNPSGDSTIHVGDILVAIGHADSLRRLKELARASTSSKFKVQGSKSLDET